MNIIDLAAIIGHIDSTINYLRQNHLLKQSYDHCGKPCLQIYDDHTSDKWMFRCRTCRRKFSIRQNSIFSNSKLKLPSLVVIVYAFANDFSVSNAKKLLKDVVSERAIIQWFTYLREICSQSLLNNPIRLGANGSIVQIDEAVIGSKRKYNRGYQRGIQQWIFGLIDVTTKQTVLRLVPDRKATTLVPIINKSCVANAEIHSDEAAMYQGLAGHGFTHKTVCHTDNFVAPNGVHTNNIEGFWGHLKNHFR